MGRGGGEGVVTCVPALLACGAGVSVSAGFAGPVEPATSWQRPPLDVETREFVFADRGSPVWLQTLVTSVTCILVFSFEHGRRPGSCPQDQTEEMLLFSF